jgi:hypothetical protein
LDETSSIGRGPNPFRPGETMDVAAKAASRKVKVLPLKKLKAMIA